MADILIQRFRIEAIKSAPRQQLIKIKQAPPLISYSKRSTEAKESSQDFRKRNELLNNSKSIYHLTLKTIPDLREHRTTLEKENALLKRTFLLGKGCDYSINLKEAELFDCYEKRQKEYKQILKIKKEEMLQRRNGFLNTETGYMITLKLADLLPSYEQRQLEYAEQIATKKANDIRKQFIEVPNSYSISLKGANLMNDYLSRQTLYAEQLLHKKLAFRKVLIEAPHIYQISLKPSDRLSTYDDRQCRYLKLKMITKRKEILESISEFSISLKSAELLEVFNERQIEYAKEVWNRYISNRKQIIDAPQMYSINLKQALEEIAYSHFISSAATYPSKTSSTEPTVSVVQSQPKSIQSKKSKKLQLNRKLHSRFAI